MTDGRSSDFPFLPIALLVYFFIISSSWGVLKKPGRDLVWDGTEGFVPRIVRCEERLAASEYVVESREGLDVMEGEEVDEEEGNGMGLGIL